MTANSAAATTHVYQLVQIPTSLGVCIDVPASSIDEVRSFALGKVDTSTRWVIKLDGRTLADAIEVVRYRYDDATGKPVGKTFNSTAPRAGYFETPEEAVADYRCHLAEASRRLDVIVQRVRDLQKELSFDLNYTMQGDTHGIYEDYQYVSVTIGGYAYRRAL